MSDVEIRAKDPNSSADVETARLVTDFSQRLDAAVIKSQLKEEFAKQLLRAPFRPEDVGEFIELPLPEMCECPCGCPPCSTCTHCGRPT